MSDEKVVDIHRGKLAPPQEPAPNVLAKPPATLPPGMPPILAVFHPAPEVAQALKQNMMAFFQQNPSFYEAVSVVRTDIMKAQTSRQFKYAIVFLDPMTPEERAEADAKARSLMV